MQVDQPRPSAIFAPLFALDSPVRDAFCVGLCCLLLGMGAWLPPAHADAPGHRAKPTAQKPFIDSDKDSKQSSHDDDDDDEPSTSKPTSRPTSRPASKVVQEDLWQPTSMPASRPAKAKMKAKAKAKKKAKPYRPSQRALRHWLALGPAFAPMPAFHKEKDGAFNASQLLASRHLAIKALKPRAGQKVQWLLGRTLRWRPSHGYFRLRHRRHQVGYLATYLEVPQYAELTLKLRSHQRIRAFLDGQLVATKATCTPRPTRHKAKPAAKKKATAKAKSKGAMALERKTQEAQRLAGQKTEDLLLGKLAELLAQQMRTIQKQADTIAKQNDVLVQLQRKRATRRPVGLPQPGLVQATLKLTPGLHLLVLKTLYSPECRPHWHVQGALHSTKKSPIPPALQSARTAYERHSLNYYFHRIRIGMTSISPDGQHVVISLYRWTKHQQWEHWVELRRVKDNRLLHSSRPHYRLSGLQWSPDGKYYSFVSNGGRLGMTLWLARRSNMEVRPLLRNIKHMGAHTWAPNSKFIVYHVTQLGKPTPSEKIGAKRVRGMGDRWPWYRNRSHLYAVTVQNGISTRLTAGRWSVGGVSIHPNGKRILFARSQQDYSKRPFYYTDLFELDLRTMHTRKLLSRLYWFNQASYSPDGKQILMLGGPSMLGHLGRSPAMPFSATLNDYEGDAYLYDPQKRSFQALTRQFNPHVTGAYWHPLDGKIYMSVLDKSRYRLVQYDPQTHHFAYIHTGTDIAAPIYYARNTSHIAYVGQGLDHSERVFTLDLFHPFPRLLHDPNQKWFSRLQLAQVKPWVTYSRKGVRIEGRVYYPPDFDPRKKYPAIVYYYGGTFPTPRYFDGAYSGQLWAAHGYITYILQPSGAVGFGQQHAARHVNEWGSLVAQEIIDATKQFLEEHPFVDKKRVGCTGASYGGFMTMSIVTKTKLFAAAISHAGISNITSYWGAGFWGFWYSAIATAHRYPWSHPYFYIKNSPLYFAHKIKTPLLLLHGDVDTNVPPAESYQMYTALRLLKKPVELVLFHKEGHGVGNFKKRTIWMKTILAWFDRYLKKQPLWWKQMHGTRQY